MQHNNLILCMNLVKETSLSIINPASILVIPWTYTMCRGFWVQHTKRTCCCCNSLTFIQICQKSVETPPNPTCRNFSLATPLSYTMFSILIPLHLRCIESYSKLRPNVVTLAELSQFFGPEG